MNSWQITWWWRSPVVARRVVSQLLGSLFGPTANSIQSQESLICIVHIHVINMFGCSVMSIFILLNFVYIYTLYLIHSIYIFILCYIFIQISCSDEYTIKRKKTPDHPTPQGIIEISAFCGISLKTINWFIGVAFFKIWHDLTLLPYWKECMNLFPTEPPRKDIWISLDIWRFMTGFSGFKFHPWKHVKFHPL